MIMRIEGNADELEHKVCWSVITQIVVIFQNLETQTHSNDELSKSIKSGGEPKKKNYPSDPACHKQSF